MVLFGVVAVQTIDRWYLVRGRGGNFLWLAGKSSHMIYASGLHFFVETTRDE